ncbi:membrane protein [Amylibacter ulvae]|uniref:Probable membrane transporter protein n=1 Tax=Paramylibacter ulvae TaxID=1651968 RepID=A0ABQ3D1F4_9RHOB|nr:sulfite exporter TauE/SafE family protein [Amylibacter ulvae]GHA53710.1 membrane protein [Amylibacter ulvae]
MELIQQALHIDGLWLLIFAVSLAGLVRGFAGFGTAMVFMPFAAQVVEPITAIIMLLVFDLFGPLALLPRAWRDGEPRDVGLLGFGAIIGLPFGVYLLTQLDPVVFRWMVSCLALMMLVLLISGWRYTNPLNAIMTSLVGVISGFLCGIAALPGPPVILSYMSSPRAPAMVRGNTILYLFLVDIMTFVVFLIKGLLTILPMVIGVILAVPYGIGGLVGQWIFNPDKEHIYRRVAYAIIGISALAGMPIWD